MIGEYGIRNGFPNDFISHRFVNNRMKPNNIPIIPNTDDNIINKYLYALINDWKSWYEKNIELISVIATTITIIGEIIPADTAASPNTSAPNMERDVPLDDGFNASASYNISKVNINISASINAGNGTVYRCVVKFINRLVGNICWSYVINDKYMDGAKIVIKNANSRIIFINFV